MSFFNIDNEEKENINDFYNARSHQDCYFIDVSDKTNYLQYCRQCDCFRSFMYDRCTTCGCN